MMAASLCRSPRRHLNVLAMYMAIQTVLFLCTTDIVTDSDGVPHTVVIYEGFALHHALLCLDGRDLTEYLMKNLTEQGVSFTASAESEIAREVREKLRYFGADYDTELESTAETNKEKTHELSDVHNTTVGTERLRCAEVLFQPSFIGEEACGINDTSSLTKCDVDTRKKLCANVVPSGGTAIFQGIVERMTNELTALSPSTMRSRWLFQFGMNWRILSWSSQTEHHHCRRLRFLHEEVLFQPSGFRDTSFQNITKCDFDLRKNLYAMSCCQVARPRT